MLYILLMLILLLPALAGLGEVFTKFIHTASTGISVKIIGGIFGTTVFWTIIAFFTPLNHTVEAITLLIGLISFFYLKIYLKFWLFFQNNGKLFSPLLLVTLFFGSYFPFILDHFGYYVPSIKWISEVGLVQGISNLDLLLGQMSLWHIFQAGFSNFSDPFLRINVLVLIVYLIYILEKKSWIHLVFAPFFFLFSQSPSPDLPAVIFSLIILNEVFLKNQNTGFLFSFSCFVFAIKPTMMWLPIFVFFYSIFLDNKSFRILFFGFFVLLLFIFKNMWTFGFPIFPVQVFDLGFSWKPNSELLQNSSEVAIKKTFDMQYQYAEIQKFSALEFIKNWLFLKGIKGKIHLLFVVSLLVFLIFSIYKKSRIIWILFLSVLLKSLLVLIFSAQYRFFFDVFFVVFFIILFKGFAKKTAIPIFGLLSIFFISFLSFPNLVKEYFPSFRLGNYMTGFSRNQFYKPAYFELNDFKTYQIGNLKFNVVENYIFSFDTPIPAISPQFIQEDLDAGIFPQLKGKNLKEGFIWKEISDPEKTQIRKILHNSGIK